MSRTPDWAHLMPLVDALVAGGNTAKDGGFRPNQGGVDCWMEEPLDLDLLAPLIGGDDQVSKITTSPDEVFCRHCWASIHGPAQQ